MMASLSRRHWTYKGKDRYAWSIRWKDEGGHYRSRQFASKDKAEQFLAQFSGGRRDPYEPLPEEVTVRYAAKQFLQWTAQRRRNGVIERGSEENVKTLVNRHIIERIGHLRLTELRLPILVRWHDQLRRERSLSARGSRRSARQLRAVIDFAMRREWIDRNRVTDLLVELRGIPEPKIATFSVDDVRVLLTAIEVSTGFGTDRSHRLAQCFVHIAAFCGLRWGEIAALDLDHIDLGAGIIRVRKAVGYGGELKAPKTVAGNRDVPMPRHVAKLIETWCRDFSVKNRAGLIFTTSTGALFDHGSFRLYCWLPALTAAGLVRTPSFHFHALRHFAASFMIKNGWPLTDVSAMLGHARVNMTLDVYAHALTDLEARLPAMQALADQVLPAANQSPALIHIGA